MSIFILLFDRFQFEVIEANGLLSPKAGLAYHLVIQFDMPIMRKIRDDILPPESNDGCI